VTLAKVLAPLIPFVTEEMYQNLVRAVDLGAPESVHHCDFPTARKELVDADLMESMALAIKIASLGRSARGQAGVKLRQPLSSAVVVGPFGDRADPLGALSDFVVEELNVKQLLFTDDASALVTYVLKPDLRLLGPKFGARLPDLLEALATLDAEAGAAKLQGGEAVAVTVDGQDIHLSGEEVSAESRPREGYEVSREGDYLVAVDVTLTDDLIEEGLARELVRRIQNLRKDADFRIEDKIVTYYEGDSELTAVVRDYAEYISQETLSVEMIEGRAPEGSHTGQFSIEGKTVAFHLVTVSGDGRG
jgi:isoleucyl-tRNA synthetase